jgi:hypothetical protein
VLGYFQFILLAALIAVLFVPGIMAEMRLFPPMSGGVSDLALKGVDGDALNRAPIAHAIRALLLNPKSEAPFTVAICAPWGHGKTSVLNMVDTLMRDHMSVVHLNPWHFREDGHMLASLLESMRGEAIPQGLTWRNLRFRFRLFWFRSASRILTWLFVLAALSVGLAWIGRLPSPQQLQHAASTALEAIQEGLRYLLVAANVKQENASPYEKGLTGLLLVLPALAAFKALRDKLAPLSPGFRRMIKHVQSAWTELPGSEWVRHAGLRYQFQQEFSTLCTALGKGGWFDRRTTRPGMLLLIDDLDRCDPRQIETVVSTLNFLFATPAACYAVLGIDWNKVVSALSLHLGELAVNEPEIESLAPNPGRAYAERYLEKIIQLRIDLPQDHSAPATVEPVAPELALPTINWWALPARLLEGASGMALRLGELAAAGVLMLAKKAWGARDPIFTWSKSKKAAGSTALAEAGRSIRQSLSGPRWPTRAGLKRRAFAGLILIAVLAPPLLAVAWAAQRLDLGWNLHDVDLMTWFLAEATLGAGCCVLALGLLLRRAHFVGEVRRIFGPAPASAKAAPLFLPPLLYGYLTERSLLVGIALLYVMLSVFHAFIVGMRSSGDARRGASFMDLVACGTVGLFLVYQLPVDSPRLVTNVWMLGTLYIVLCIFEYCWRFNDRMASQHLSRRTTLVFHWASTASVGLLNVVRAARRRDILVASLALAAVLWGASQAPPFAPAATAQHLLAPTDFAQTGPAALTGAAPPDVSLLETLLIVVKALAGVTLVVLAVVWLYKSKHWIEFSDLFMRDHVVVFETALATWEPHLRKLPLSPRAKKQLINRARYVVNRWHVECDSVAYRWSLFCARLKRRLRAWLNDEEWQVRDTATPMNANLLSNLTLLNSLTFGQLLREDAAFVAAFAGQYELGTELAAVLGAIGSEPCDPPSLPHRQLLLWKSYEDTLPFPISWRPEREQVVFPPLQSRSA